ncbi:MAG: AbrB/MazE/SpoVT family DNA-binding domain-containing protein [Dehalococcoidales bacterium]|nr:AbrB/MazE/SpoVT family DNA-binding domain-containing protein [Dehalococcoidales bacterium]
MRTIETSRMSSKGQIVIPEEIRNRLGLKTGDKFLVIGDKDVVILKTLTATSIDEFDDLIKKARKQAKAAGLKRADIVNAIAKSREQK